MPQTARHKVDLLAAAAAADFSQINTSFSEFDTSAALEGDLLTHAHGATGDHGGPVTRAAALVATLGLTIQTGALTILQQVVSYVASLGPTVHKTGNYTCTSSDIGSLIIADSANAIMTLPLTSQCASGAQINIKAGNTGVSIIRQGTDTIFGATAGQSTLSPALTLGDAISFRNDPASTQWVAA